MKTGAVEVWHLAKGSRQIAQVKVDIDGWSKEMLLALDKAIES
jgi:hypothetical protein